MQSKIKSYIELVRLDKPIGIYLLLWPSLLGLILGSIQSSQISFKNILIVLIGAVLVRSCGCIINDISDHKLDKLVKRTANRPIVNGAISLKEAWLFFIFLGLCSLYLLTFTPYLTMKVALAFAVMIMIYPLTKRFFMAPQFILGITFGSGTLISYSLESNIFSPSIFILYMGVISWIISFDTFYALEDFEDDKKIGINSTPILWGKDAVKNAKALHYIFYISLVIIAYINNFSLFFVLIMSILLILNRSQIKLIEEKKYLETFKFNNWIGIVVTSGFAIEVFLI